MGEVDSAFIQAIEHRPKLAVTEADGIPLIDLSPLNSSDSNAIARLATEIGDACKNWGFFQVINHGVPLDCREKIESASRTFFTQSLEEKSNVRRGELSPMGYYDGEHTKNVRDWKEVFDFVVQIPTLIPASHEPDDKELKMLHNQWPVCKRFNEFFKDKTSFLRLNYYPCCPVPHLALGVGRHKDAGALTVLAQDDVGGLEVKRKTDGEWIRVKPTPNAYIVNVGDIIQVWSNDKYESVEHRVMVNSEKERFSIPFFFNPAHYTMVEPLKELLDDHQNRAKYEAFNWGKFVAARNLSNFKKLDLMDHVLFAEGFRCTMPMLGGSHAITYRFQSCCTGIAEAVETYSAAIKDVSVGLQEVPPLKSIQDKANAFSENLRSDQTTATGKVQDGLQYLSYVVVSTSMPAA
ncbi:2-oxoglutarate (2OG) and Fe(II)-dependent oxygenase superfamily protein [Actinidia rufa]|uniref:2-oxoglutarate (2OG) and Fe(II)-dependent oxygenase superfamily protein n=1 Tax=Actinidia rufa TaxID=165716 RepID=A0A7J0ET93_9ERIC|nr:2-oxoglutarate (2OG) and Fe(II)-dependent oxygenase superfamily protein [Actinidia rufa]